MSKSSCRPDIQSQPSDIEQTNICRKSITINGVLKFVYRLVTTTKCGNLEYHYRILQCGYDLFKVRLIFREFVHRGNKSIASGDRLDIEGNFTVYLKLFEERDELTPESNVKLPKPGFQNDLKDSRQIGLVVKIDYDELTAGPEAVESRPDH